jgi:hypothetical protein
MTQAQEASMANVVSVSTQETAEAIIMAGGTEPWALDRKRASSSDFLVCCRKAGKQHSGEEKVGAGFLIGRINDVVPSQKSEGRWKITISHYALVYWPREWDVKRKNPVAYWESEKHPNEDGETNYFENLEFKPIFPVQDDAGTTTREMSVAEAKAGLALKFGVDESAIEITIRM